MRGLFFEISLPVASDGDGDDDDDDDDENSFLPSSFKIDGFVVIVVVAFVESPVPPSPPRHDQNEMEG